MTYESILAAFGITEDSLRQQAEQYVKQDLVFYAIVQAEGLTITEDEYDTHILEYVEGSGVGVAEFEAYYGRDKLIESMLWDEMIEIIYSSAVITK
jgi:FKBP-type peptidyl-prolyl cis-trans isomerase (trigger factor)